ncbi:hypothetical protein [Nocardia sp. NPDC052566]
MTGASACADAVTGAVRGHVVPTTHWHMATGVALARIGAVLTEIGQISDQ